MEKQIIRGLTTGLFAAANILSIGFIGFAARSFYIFGNESMPTGIAVFGGALAFLFFVFGLFLFVKSILDYWMKIELYEDKIVFSYPFRKKVLSVDDLSFWGCVSYMPRGSMLFFCTADRDTVINYLHSNWHRCEKIFGEETVNQLKDTEEGILHLALSTYLRKGVRYSSRDVLILDQCSICRLRSLVNLLERDAIITGPWNLKTRNMALSWEKYAKYRP